MGASGHLRSTVRPASCWLLRPRPYLARSVHVVIASNRGPSRTPAKAHSRAGVDAGNGTSGHALCRTWSAGVTDAACDESVSCAPSRERTPRRIDRCGLAGSPFVDIDGFGSFESASRFCTAFDELNDYLRMRRRGERGPSLSAQRRLFAERWQMLIVELHAA